jgi:hypothetical protein
VIVDSLTDLAVTTNPAARGSGKRGFGGLSLSFSFTEPSLLSGKIVLKTAPLLLICQKYEVVRLKSAARIVKRTKKGKIYGLSFIDSINLTEIIFRRGRL